MTTGSTAMSLTRPSAPEKEYGKNAWQFNAGLLLALTGVMLLMVFFVISAVVAGWVSDQDPADFGRIIAYNSWLRPFAIASMGMIMIGIAIILFGIVRKLWVRVESVKESLQVLAKHGSGS
ncbi:MAG: hypothetical protein IIB19_03610 [Chloroflexi bacterium]|nr:hypothetical protein [Chloroflexota bacterium]